MKNKQKKIRVTWIDAVLYGASSKKNNLHWKPNLKLTEGISIQESRDGVLIKDPRTFSKDDGERVAQEKKRKARFLFIPSGMIKSME